MDYVLGYLLIGLIFAVFRLSYSLTTERKITSRELFVFTPFIILFWPFVLLILITVVTEKK